MAETKTRSTIGIDKVHYAIMTDEIAETYGPIKRLAGAIDMSVSTTTNDATQYADNGAWDTVNSEAETAVQLQLVDITPAIKAEILGLKMDENGVLMTGQTTSAPYIALGFEAIKSDKVNKRFVWFLKGRASTSDENYHTLEGGAPTLQEPTMNITFINRAKDGLKKFEVDTDADTNGVTEDWFAKVYEPNTTAIANADLSSIGMGALTLTPAFDPNVLEYETDTTNATNTINVTLADPGATVSILNGTIPVPNGSAATWEEGENTVTIKVTNGTATKTYTVVVTKS